MLLFVHKNDDRALLLVVTQNLQQLQELLVLIDHQLQKQMQKEKEEKGETERDEGSDLDWVTKK